MRAPRHLALTIGVAVFAVASAPAGASPPQQPVLAIGRIVDSGGHPVAGLVEVRAWPTGLPMTVGDVVDPPLVTTSTADRAGRFTLRAPASPELWRLAEVNNGFVNFVMSTPGGGEWHFSRYVGTRHAMTTSDGTDVQWQGRPDSPAEPLDIELPPEPSAPPGAAAIPIRPSRTCVAITWS